MRLKVRFQKYVRAFNYDWKEAWGHHNEICRSLV